jgi:hypothetical protein
MVKHFKDPEAGVAQFEDYAEGAIKSVVTAANRFDPERGARFTTYVWKGIKGAFVDWQKTQAPPSWEDSDSGYVPESGSYETDDRIVYRRVHWDDELRKQIKAEARLNVFEGYVLDQNLLTARPKSPEYMARQLDVTVDYMYVIISRAKKKLAPALHRQFFVRKRRD